MQRCETCKYWVSTQLGDTYHPLGVGDCYRTKPINEAYHEDDECDAVWNNDENGKMHTSNYYGSALITKPDFGCVEHALKDDSSIVER